MKNNLLLLCMVVPVISGCAGTAKTLSSSKVFAPSCPITDLPTRTNDDLKQTSFSELWSSAIPAEDKDTKGLEPRCSQKESVYSNAIWIPVLGPLFDLSTNTNPGRRGFWYFLSTVLPIIGPTAQLSYGAKQCIAECMPRPPVMLPNQTSNVQSDTSKALTDDEYLKRALNVSDSNCRTFLRRFYAGLSGANESKDTLNSISTITATGAAFANPVAGAIISGTKTILSDGITSYNANYLQGKVMPDLISTIQIYRTTTRKKIEDDVKIQPLKTREEVVTYVNNYDEVCSIDSAIQTMLGSVKNQSTGDDKKNSDDKVKALELFGMPAPTPIAVPVAPGIQSP